MQKTIGQLIGTVVDNFSTTNTAGVSVQIRTRIDYSTVGDAEIISWLNGNRRIPLQRVLRGLSAEEIKGLDGTVFDADSIGKKVKPRAEVVAEYYKAFMLSGQLTEDEAMEWAEKAADNRAGVQKAIEVTKDEHEENMKALQDEIDERSDEDEV